MSTRKPEVSVDREPLLTVDEMAARLRLAPWTIREMARTGRIPAVKLGRSWRFRQHDVDRWQSRLSA